MRRHRHACRFRRLHPNQSGNGVTFIDFHEFNLGASASHIKGMTDVQLYDTLDAHNFYFSEFKESGSQIISKIRLFISY